MIILLRRENSDSVRVYDGTIDVVKVLVNAILVDSPTWNLNVFWNKSLIWEYPLYRNPKQGTLDHRPECIEFTNLDNNILLYIMSRYIQEGPGADAATLIMW